MKKIICLLGFFVAFGSCEKDVFQGPQGKLGEQGQNGRAGFSAGVHSEVFTVTEADWQSTPGIFAKEAILTVPVITKAVLDSALIRVYQIDEGYDVVMPIYQYYPVYMVTWAEISEGEVKVILDADKFIYVPEDDLQFKVVIGDLGL